MLDCMSYKGRTCSYNASNFTLKAALPLACLLGQACCRIYSFLKSDRLTNGGENLKSLLRTRKWIFLHYAHGDSLGFAPSVAIHKEHHPVQTSQSLFQSGWPCISMFLPPLLVNEKGKVWYSIKSIILTYRRSSYQLQCQQYTDALLIEANILSKGVSTVNSHHVIAVLFTREFRRWLVKTEEDHAYMNIR